VTAERVHTGSVRQVILLPEPNLRPEVEARRKAGADSLRPTEVASSGRETSAF